MAQTRVGENSKKRIREDKENEADKEHVAKKFKSMTNSDAPPRGDGAQDEHSCTSREPTTENEVNKGEDETGKKKTQKKSVRWASEEKLCQYMCFERIEGERYNVAKAKHIMNRQIDFYDKKCEEAELKGDDKMMKFYLLAIDRAIAIYQKNMGFCHMDSF